jgi:hypothetical protein
MNENQNTEPEIERSDMLPHVIRSAFPHGNRNKKQKKAKALIEHLLRFNRNWTITVEHIHEYLNYQSIGGEEPKNNPLLDCQKWKEWTITQMVEEAFEWWCANAGWAIPLIRSVECDGGEVVSDESGKFIIKSEKANDPIMVKAIGKLITGIEERGMLEFYMKHAAYDGNEEKLLRQLKTKYGDDFEFEKAKTVAVL